MIHAVGFVFMFVSIFWMGVHLVTTHSEDKDHTLLTLSMVAMAIGFFMVQI